MAQVQIRVSWFSLLVGLAAGVHPSARSNQLFLRAETNATKTPSGSGATCVANTGGTCSSADCHSWRGSTTCSENWCVCQPGLCSSVSGRCVAAQNELVSKAFTLRNARYSDRFLVITTSPGLLSSISAGHLGVYSTTDIHHAGRVLSLYSLPIADVAHDGSAYLIASHDGELSASCHDAGESGLMMRSNKATETSMMNSGVQLRLAPAYEGAPPGVQSIVVEFLPFAGSADGSETAGGYLFMDSLGKVGAAPTLTGAGVGSVWLPDPPIPGITHLYDGPECSWDCGAFGSGTNGSSRFYVVIFVYALLVGLGVGLIFFVGLTLKGEGQ